MFYNICLVVYSSSSKYISSINILVMALYENAIVCQCNLDNKQTGIQVIATNNHKK